MAKGRKEAEFKKKYTERSEVSATEGMKNAKKGFNKEKKLEESFMPKPAKKKDNPKKA